MNRELSAEMSALLHKAGMVGVKKIYLDRSRNPDPAIRAKFEKNSNIEGSFEWAVGKCLSLLNHDYTDEECIAISAALDRREK